MSLSENMNKENILYSVSPKKNQQSGNEQLVTVKLEQDVKKLERLYKAEVLKSQSVLVEQEKLEMDLFKKEKTILQQQQHLQKMTELNKSLSKKLSGEVSFYESAINSYKKFEKEWEQKSKRLQNGQLKLEHLLQKKNDELLQLSHELETSRNELDMKDSELGKLSNKLSSTYKKLEELEASIPEQRGEPITTYGDLTGSTDSQFDDSNDNNDRYDDEEYDGSSDDGAAELSSFVLEEEIEEDGANFDITDNSSSLANEINDQLHENVRIIKKYEFEIRSLKNEKIQLYNYINKLLKNRPNPDQNTILKEKLVKRKILRAISINQIVGKNTFNGLSKNRKRVVSNYVNFKNYGGVSRKNKSYISSPMHNSQNSEDEDDQIDEDELRIFGNQNFGHSVFKGSFLLMNPLDFLLAGSQDSNDNPMDLDIE